MSRRLLCYNWLTDEKKRNRGNQSRSGSDTPFARLYNQPSLDSVNSISLFRDFAYLVALMFVYRCEYSYWRVKPAVANLTTLLTDKSDSSRTVFRKIAELSPKFGPAFLFCVFLFFLETQRWIWNYNYACCGNPPLINRGGGEDNIKAYGPVRVGNLQGCW
jgi:hypothetical protein